MKLQSFFLACFCCLACLSSAQIGIAPAVLDFGDVTQGVPKSMDITIDNPSPWPLYIKDINPYHGDAFTLTDTAFTILPGANHVVTITCNPRHNIDYADWMLVKSSSHPEVPSVYMKAVGHYPEAYYNATQNLSNEALKTALSAIVTTGMVAHTYNESRDQMYMIIDNKAVNGQGATQNTLECIYTGILAVGYTSRTDAQNNYNLNTEHTMPQSLFGSTVPELSDLHHLFVTTAPANSERGNNPFGIVTSPSWMQGGSKSNGSRFEPRDEQKGPSIRALLYFLFRYQDYQGFICGMETTLRDWNSQYLPDSIERSRNDAIHAYQHNRNPFVDHPEFLDRIAGLCSTNNGNPSPIAQCIGDTLHFWQTLVNDSLDGYYAIANQGIDTLNITNISVNGSDFLLLGPVSLAIPKDSIARIPLRFRPTVNNTQSSSNLTFSTDAPSLPTRSVFLSGNSFVIAVDAYSNRNFLKVFPQPAHENVRIQLPIPARAAGKLTIWNLAGQSLRTIPIAKGDEMIDVSVAGLNPGILMLRLELGNVRYSQKLSVE